VSNDVVLPRVGEVALLKLQFRFEIGIAVPELPDRSFDRMRPSSRVTPIPPPAVEEMKISSAARNPPSDRTYLARQPRLRAKLDDGAGRDPPEHALIRRRDHRVTRE